jgi:hypothetical protein
VDIPNIDGNPLQTCEEDDKHLEEEQQKTVQQPVLDIAITAADP